MTSTSTTLPHSELMHLSRLMWALLDDELNVVEASGPFLRRFGDDVALPRPLTHFLPTLSGDQQMSLRYLEQESVFHLISRDGRGLQCEAVATGSSATPIYLSLFQFKLDNRWLMELHPDYNHALQSSDQWVGHLESIIKAAPEETLLQVVANAATICGCSAGYLLHYQPENRRLTLNATSWESGQLQTALHLDDFPALAMCVDEGASYICNGADNEMLPFLATHDLDSHLCVPVTYRGKIAGLVGVFNRDTPFTEVDAKTLTIYATVIWHAIQLPRTLRVVAEQSRVIRQQKQQLNHSLVQLVGAIAEALEVNDPYTAGHQRSVAKLAHSIGRRMGLDHHRLEGLKLGGMIHDIGKLAIPTQLLTKPSQLSDEEYELIKTHSQRGAEIIDEVAFPWPIREMILQHHERLDGSGYPFGLTGDQILLESQILAVADVSDSILSHRPYRPALGYHKLREVLEEGKGSLFNTQAVELCLEILSNQRGYQLECVDELPLIPVLALGLDNTLAQAEERMAQRDISVALVMDDDGQTVLGYITSAMLAFWHSPLLDTAAERTLDRELLQRKLHQLMKHRPPTIDRSAPLEAASAKLQSCDEHFLLVIDSLQRPKGLLTWPTLAQAMQERLAMQNAPQSRSTPIHPESRPSKPLEAVGVGDHRQ